MGLKDNYPKAVIYNEKFYHSRNALAVELYPDNRKARSRLVNRLAYGWPVNAAVRGFLIRFCHVCHGYFPGFKYGVKYCSGECRYAHARGTSRRAETRAQYEIKNRDRLNLASRDRQRAIAADPELKAARGERVRKWRRKQCEDLTDIYIRKLLTKDLPDGPAMPAGLIGLKRAEIKLKREVKKYE